MNSRERVIAALERQQPDRIPLVEWVIDSGVYQALLPNSTWFEFNDWIGLDSIGFNRSSWDRKNVEFIDEEKRLFRDHWGVLRMLGPESSPYPVEPAIKKYSDLDTYVPPDPEEDALSEEDDDTDEDTALPPEPDDLRRIAGIGPATHRKLVGLGFKTFAALAELTDDALADLERELGSRRPSRDDWRGQAAALLSSTEEDA